MDWKQTTSDIIRQYSCKVVSYQPAAAQTPVSTDIIQLVTQSAQTPVSTDISKLVTQICISTDILQT